MGKVYGNNGGIQIGNILKPTGKQPLDDRFVVDSVASLTAANTFKIDGESKDYVGMFVSVVNPSNAEENAIYQLVATPHTNAANWKRIGAPRTENTLRLKIEGYNGNKMTVNDLWFGSKTNS